MNDGQTPNTPPQSGDDTPRLATPTQPEAVTPRSVPGLPPIVTPEQPPTATQLSTKPRRRRTLMVGIVTIVALLIAGGIAIIGWYYHELSPVNSHITAKTRVIIKSGMSPHSIAETLENSHLIRSQTVFYTYLTLSHQRDQLQAGAYLLSPSESSQAIVRALVGGKVGDFSITFYPGGMLNGTKATEKAAAVTTQLQKAGYTNEEIQAALSMNYDEPVLFSGKPAGSSLEGFVYGDTYNFAVDTPVSDIIQRSLDEFSNVVTKQDLIALYNKQDLTLFQGITLASIIQREINAPSGNHQPTTDQRQVAQIFLKRLRSDMTLGSDVTYYYAAEQLGVTPSPGVDSPYNTRLNKGLPPGPIAVPSFSALLAVAQPAATDYLYFLTGDNGKTYYSTTAAGHDQNIQQHCHQMCGN